MDIKAYMDEFGVRFLRLKNNRDNIPLEQLTTKYAKAYNALVGWLEKYAEWFTQEYINCLALSENPKDTAGNAKMQSQTTDILKKRRNYCYI